VTKSDVADFKMVTSNATRAVAS